MKDLEITHNNGWVTTQTSCNEVRLLVQPVNTKKWYRKGTDFWAELGDEMPFD
jgi:hypothetical protein